MPQQQSRPPLFLLHHPRPLHPPFSPFVTLLVTPCEPVAVTHSSAQHGPASPRHPAAVLMGPGTAQHMVCVCREQPGLSPEELSMG